ncbi:hypothetical protein ACFSKW_16040 [Nonomuraea mangrovi]|uniref:Uncharacterized protein n=1 Tax=Nonomuraea mangrovi TaxID=2316207 RepID=A0ABW4SU03_9ACTN
MIALIAAGALGLAVLIGFVTIVVSIHREDRAMSLDHAPKNGSSAFARRVTGCHVGRGVSWT